MKVTLQPWNGQNQRQMIPVIKIIRGLTSIGLKEARTIANNIFDDPKMPQEINCLKRPESKAFKDYIAELHSYGINVKAEDIRTSNLQALKAHLKASIVLCNEENEGEILEAISTAFKIICEKVT